jgi:hypothetical protein
MPIVGVATFALIVVLATILIVAAMVSRYKQRELQHRERMAAVEKGVALPAESVTQPEPFHPRTYLLRGLMWLFIGIAISISFAGLAMLAQHQEPAWVRVDEATHAKERGASDAEVVQIMNDKHNDGPNPGIGLIGLIPIGVGLAYLITYRSERSRVE